MDNLLKGDIEAAIAKNMPQAVGQHLQTLLKEAETNARIVKTQQDDITRLRKDVITRDDQLREHGSLKDREARVINREDIVSERERVIDITLLEIRLEESDRRAETTFKLVDKLVRNNTFKKTILDTEDVGGLPIVDGQGFAHYPMARNKHYSETKTED